MVQVFVLGGISALKVLNNGILMTFLLAIIETHCIKGKYIQKGTTVFPLTILTSNND